MIAAAAVWSLIETPPSGAELAGLLALLAAAALVHTVPVPIQGVPIGGTMLSSVFTMGTAVIYGWAAAVLIALLVQLLVEPLRSRAPLRLAYNGAVHSLAAGGAGAAAGFATADDEFAELALGVAAAAATYYVINVVLVAAIVARSSREPLRLLLRRTVVTTAGIFAILGSLSLILVALWQESPFLAAALAGPLAAIALYQRSLLRELRSMQLALTDPLTGLGNRRGFEERLAAELEATRVTREPLAICLLDVDDLKQVNDAHGHPSGDDLLVQLSRLFRQDGEAFRLGGDEFALLLPGSDAAEALEIADAVLARAERSRTATGDPIYVSAGVAVYPLHAAEAKELVGVADIALYWAKRQGKRVARVYRRELRDLTELRRVAEGADATAKHRAAAALATAVDAHDSYLGTHSPAVGDLAALLAERLGLGVDEAEAVRLAGALHDLGKLAIPEQILGKPGPLTDGERMVIRQHPLIGFRLLDSFGFDPVARYVRHHHEEWDGGGYPDGLAREEIPLASRILFVADAYDAMTTDRVYGPRLSHEQALAELVRNAGTQFDPQVVSAFVERLTRAEIDAASAG